MSKSSSSVSWLNSSSISEVSISSALNSSFSMILELSSSEEKIEENESEDKNSVDNNLSIDEKEEFSAEETETSGIDDEFNQETEEELLDIPTFLRRQAN